MKIVFEGFSHPIAVGVDAAAVLEVHDKMLFTRVCQSLLSELGPKAIEPFSLLDEEGEPRSARNAFLFVSDPLDLPWEHRSLLGRVRDRVESAALSDEDLRWELESSARGLIEKVESLGLLLRSDYELEVEWDVGKFLKSFDFGVERSSDDSLLDNLSKFLRFASDALFGEVIVFVHLKNYLTEAELESFYEEAFFSGIQVLLLESVPDMIDHPRERKTIIDQDFLQM